MYRNEFDASLALQPRNTGFSTDPVLAAWQAVSPKLAQNEQSEPPIWHLSFWVFIVTLNISVLAGLYSVGRFFV